MPRYAYTGPYPAVLPNLSYGVNAHVEPGENRPDEADVITEGATVVLYPGDHLTTEEEYVQFYLDPEDGPSPRAQSVAVDENVGVSEDVGA